jgi:hypothetical protein
MHHPQEFRQPPHDVGGTLEDGASTRGQAIGEMS